MYDPYKTSSGEDSELGQLVKIGQSTGGRNPIQEERYQTLLTQANANDPTKKLQDMLTQQSTDTAAQNTAQEAKQNDFLTRFRTAIGGQESLPNAATRIGGTLGLPGLQSTAQGLIKSVAQIPQVQQTATRGYNVNANQLSQIIASKQAQLAPAAQQAVTQEQTGEQQLGQQLGYLQTQQAKELQPFQTEGSMLSDQIAREMSGYTQDKQNQLQAYLAQMQAGNALTLQQLQDANSLALAHIQYTNTKQQVQNQVVGAGSSLYSPEGQYIATAPVKATAGASYNPAGI